MLCAVSKLKLAPHGWQTHVHIATIRLYATSAASSQSSSAVSPARRLEQKWIERWQEQPPKRNVDGPKFQVLAMFPYPSGNLHIGHLRVYTISDVLSRYRRMKGYNVMHPMGWDAFGLPAENAAIDRGINPAVWTYANIDRMKEQMKAALVDFDWDREVITCSPDYYKWTQKIFLMLYEAGYAYRKEAVVNWDPVDMTVLANEQIDSQGRSWRSGAIAEKRKLEQWFLAITKLAPDLEQDLGLLDQWPTKVKTMQKNWIGRSHGANITFELASPVSDVMSLHAFTTRADTLYGLNYVAIALNHPISVAMSETDPNLKAFLDRADTFPEGSKEGYRLNGIFVANPLDPQKFDIPVFVAPYVLGDYGSGAVMGVPAHDNRDAEFWKQNCNSKDRPALEVIDPPESADMNKDGVYTGKDGRLNEKCGEFAGMSTLQGIEAITHKLASEGRAEPTVHLRLRDWLISRQRFWGAPIPIIHCDTCGPVPVKEEDLPVLLPEALGKPLASSKEFYETQCPKCHGPAKRDTDTMDTFMDSSWYFFRYTDPKNTELPFHYEKASRMMPVDMYIGGVEHAILHLLYSRFISKFLANVGSWSGGDFNGEPVRRLVTQGMVHGRTFVDPDTGAFLKPEQVDNSNPLQPRVAATGKNVVISHEKMSKSKFNGADPVECIEKHGADSSRAHILFQAPVTDVLNWDEDRIVGIERWLGRVQSLCSKAVDLLKTDVDKNGAKIEDVSSLSQQDLEVWTEVQTKIEEATHALHEELTLNTLISDYMKLTRTIQAAISKDKKVSGSVIVNSVEILIKLIAPVVPANAEECWEQLLNARNRKWTSVFNEPWPEKEMEIIPMVRYSVIINGKRRFVVEAPEGVTEDQLLNVIRQAPESQQWIQDKPIKRMIVPKGRSTVSLVL